MGVNMISVINQCHHFLRWIAIILIFINFTTGNSDLSNSLSLNDTGPIIEPNISEKIFNQGEEIILTCKAEAEVFWYFLTLENSPIENLTSQYVTGDPIRPYGVQLTIKSAHYNDVGEYWCILKAEQYNLDAIDVDINGLKNLNHAASIYIYVNDTINPIVDRDFQYIHGILHSEFTIPCRPTMPHIKLHLYKDSELEDEKFKYDSRNGYSMIAQDISDGGMYLCRATEPNFREVHYTVEINPPSILAKPKIYAPSYAHEGEDITLNCTIVLEIGKAIDIKWSTPNDNAAIDDGAVKIHAPVRKQIEDYDLGTSSLMVKNVIKERDHGFYTCTVYDAMRKHEHAVHSIAVFAPNKGTIELKEAGGKLTIEIDGPAKHVQWLIHYKGIPPPKLLWYDTDKKLVYPLGIGNPKYEVTNISSNVMLKIKNVTIDDAGDYNVTATNQFVTRSIILKLIVYDKPVVTIKKVEIMEGREAILHCHAKSNPRSEISWSFLPCSLNPVWPNCATVQAANDITNVSYIPTKNPNIESIDIRFTPTRPGIVRCRARNLKGVGMNQAEVIIKDIVDPIEIQGLDARVPIAEGGEFKLVCAISAYHSDGNYQWLYNDVPLEPSADISFSEYKTDYSHRIALIWKNISKTHQGAYTCRSQFRISDSAIDSKTVHLTVESPVTAEFYDNTKKHEELLVSLGEPVRRECFFKGIPYPNIQWSKDGVPITNDTRISITEENNILEISHIAPSDEGEFKCEGINKIGTDYGTLKIKIRDLPTVGKYWIILAVLIILVLLIVLIVLLIRVRRARRRLYELKSAGLANFENGCIESIDPSLSLDEQADLLPYDKKYEFPREKLTLGKQLGSGAFGVVVKGTAEGILPHEDETIVAVKTVKPNADNEVMRALISELKIMIHMGSHLNVVNLLGAVTKNIIKREVLVIVEYCRFGNVQHFMQKHRPFYVNQVNPETDEIDPSIMTIEQREQRWSNDSGYEYNSQGLKYVKLTFSNNQQPVNVRNSNNNNNNNHDDSNKLGGNRDSEPQVNSKGYTRHSKMEYFPGGIDSCNTEKSLISSSGRDDGEILSNNSIQPAWRSNYKMDYKGPARSITTSDLVCWAFQVSRGMQYLSSRKVLHGDLAARNILLCDNNVVKICDFGLARSMYKSDNYKKKGESPLPFKWLAIESISDQIFSTYSDIWAFGIVMWEFFSLAKVPYPGMNADQQLYIKLRDGYRMDKPQYANQELYDLMLNCWNAKPESRPLFNEIELRLGKLLQDSVKDHYVDLNEPYLQMNTDQFGDEKIDYLSVLAPPDEMAPVAPKPQNHYVNSVITPGMEESPSKPAGYMSMSPRSGSVSYKPTTSNFETPPSPTITNNLDNSPQMKASRRAKGIPEEVPMLSNTKATNIINSDSESESSPDRKNRILEDSLINEINDSLKQTNNYINVPSLKSSGSSQSSIGPKTKDAVSNPGYVTIDIAK